MPAPIINDPSVAILIPGTDIEDTFTGEYFENLEEVVVTVKNAGTPVYERKWSEGTLNVKVFGNAKKLRLNFTVPSFTMGKAETVTGGQLEVTVTNEDGEEGAYP